MSAAAMDGERSIFEFSNDTDDRNLADILLSLVRSPDLQYQIKKRNFQRDLRHTHGVLNAGLPSLNPCEVPGMMVGKQGGRETYYFTDNHELNSFFVNNISTSKGVWTEKGLGSIVRGGPMSSMFLHMEGYKKTYIWKDTSRCVEGIKSNWVMDVYSVIQDFRVNRSLVLCHVFEASQDYNAKPQCPTCDKGRCSSSGKHNHEGINSSTNTLFNSIPRGSSPMHNGPCQSRELGLNSYIAMFEKVLLFEPDLDPHSSMETGHYIPTRDVSPVDDRGNSHKRKKISIVWDYFTKIYAHDFEGNVVTLAACNHCSNVLTADSKSGTTHLARHTCPCKFKPVPVQAGRKDKGVVNILPSQAS